LDNHKKNLENKVDDLVQNINNKNEEILKLKNNLTDSDNKIIDQ
jgi:hypothetical protein